MHTGRLIYLIATILASLIFLFSASMYLLNYPMIEQAFEALGFPTWLIYPLAFAKIAGVLALWVQAVPMWIREWAYAGLCYDALLALTAHLMVGDGGHWIALIALVATFASRHYLYRQYPGQPIPGKTSTIGIKP